MFLGRESLRTGNELEVAATFSVGCSIDEAVAYIK